jgi:hypothetical protein
LVKVTKRQKDSLARMLEWAQAQHAEHCSSEAERIKQIEKNTRDKMADDYPRVYKELEYTQMLLKQAERELEHRMERAIAVLRGDDEEY